MTHFNHEESGELDAFFLFHLIFVKNILALGMKIFDEVLHQVDPLPGFDFIHFDEILK